MNHFGLIRRIEIIHAAKCNNKDDKLTSASWAGLEDSKKRIAEGQGQLSAEAFDQLIVSIKKEWDRFAAAQPIVTEEEIQKFLLNGR